MSEKYPQSSRNAYSDWGADFGPRQFKQDQPKKARDEDVKHHNVGGKSRKNIRHDFDQTNVTTQPDRGLSIFEGDEILAREIANEDGRSGEIIGVSNLEDGAMADEDGHLIIPETVTLESAHPGPSTANALRRANAARIAKENRAKSTIVNPLQPTSERLGGVDDETPAGGYEYTSATEGSTATNIDNSTHVDSEPPFGSHHTPDTTYSDDDELLEGVIVFTPQDDSKPDVRETKSSNEHDVVTGLVVDDSEPTKEPRTKKAKKSKQHKNLQATSPNDTSDTTNIDDQFFGPEEEPFRKFVRTSETYNDARDAYDKADKELASKVARRLKLGMFASKKTREAASAEVEAARPEYERMAEVFDAIQIEKWKLKNPAISDEEINHKLANYHEAKLRLQGLRAQHEILTAPGKFGKLSELNNKATEWFAGLSRKQKIVVGIGSVVVGAGAGLIVAAAGTVLGAGAGIAGAGLLASAKVYKTTTQGRAGLHRNAAEIDKDDFKDADGSYKTIDELRVQSSASFKKGFDQRVEKADKINKKAKWMTIASAALLGAGVAGHIDVVHDAYKAAEGGIADYFGLTDHHDVLPSGGSGARNPADLGSGDVNPHNQYTFTHHDVAPAPVTPVEVVPQDMGGATEFSGAGLDHFNQWANGHTVQPGESVWKLSQDYLQANGVRNPSVYQIDAVKDKVLAEFSAKGLVDAKGWLTAGEQLRIK